MHFVNWPLRSARCGRRAGQARLSVERAECFLRNATLQSRWSRWAKRRRSPQMAFDEKDDEKEPRGLMNSVRKQNRGQQLVCNPGNWPFPKQPSAHLNATPARLQSAIRAVIGRPPRQAQTVGVGVGGLCVPICPPRFSDLGRSKVPTSPGTVEQSGRDSDLRESATFSQPPSSQLLTLKTLHLAPVLQTTLPLARTKMQA